MEEELSAGVAALQKIARIGRGIELSDSEAREAAIAVIQAVNGVRASHAADVQL